MSILLNNKKIMVLTIVGVLLYFFYTYFTVKKFGAIIGTFNGVSAYSNQQGQTNNDVVNYVNGVYTGIKWQCVEYARRYLQTTRGITFDDVEDATQIPFAKFTTLDGSNHVQTTNDLKVGSLVVWSKYYKRNSPYGHVAIISAVQSNGIYVVEQNYDDKTFPRFIDYYDLQDTTFIYPL
jgi:glutathionylspermidine amidase/synthetase